MLNANTKSRILASRFAYEPNEEVLVNALDLCEDIINAERMQRSYNQLLKGYQALQSMYEHKCLEPVEYRRINLRG